MPRTVLRNDPRFPIASVGMNGRFPAEPSQAVSRVQYCTSPDDLVAALQQTIDAGLRPTVRSSGHCYEDFVVNNPGGALLDVSMMDQVSYETSTGYRIGPGTRLGNLYERLYKLGNVVIPGGTCYTVCAGGHISGGGYGTLARQYGLSCDWVTAIDVATIDERGHVNHRRVDAGHEPDLFRALRGGGANFGVITNFYCKELPPMPTGVLTANISWDWDEMTPEKFQHILCTYGDYWEKHANDPSTFPIFAILGLVNKSSGRIGIGMHYAEFDGQPSHGADILSDFLDHFSHCRPLSEVPTGYTEHHPNFDQRRNAPMTGDTLCFGTREMARHNWVDATIRGQSGANVYVEPRHRSKYKSCYQRKAFTPEEALAFYNALSSDETRGVIVAIDTYGGKVNDPARILDTAMPQRDSLFKLQYQSYWQDASEDAYRLAGIRKVYEAAYSTSAAHASYPGRPYPNAHYDGCYMNYPDADMLQHAEWPTLYYGTGDLYPFLQSVKKKYDPHNIFHHAMAVRA